MDMVRKFVVDNFFFGIDEFLMEDTSFLEKGNLLAWSILELAMFLEETYDIIIDDVELTPENMDSLQNIARFIDRKLNRPRCIDIEPRKARANGNFVRT